jgi:hypothetical protein
MMGQPSTLPARRLGKAATAARSAYSASQTWRVTRVQTLAVKAERARRKYELLVEGWKESKHLLGALEFILPKPPLTATRYTVDPIRTNKREVGVGNQPK